MYPVYRDMNSYPYQTPPAPFNFPSWEAFRPQMKEDGPNTRPLPEYWPSNYSYPAPMPCRNCCTHGQQPQPSNYSNFTLPCPHFPMPPSYGHYYGGYPAAYPQPYPYVPPPHYSMEMPRYEFDKGSPKAFHCCECPNHPSHVKSTSNVKIEEQDPDVGTKKATPSIPAGLSSSPRSLVWVPPRRGVEGGNSDELQVLPNVEKPKKSIQAAEQDPNVGFQWLPLDMDSIKRLMEGGELMKHHEKKDGDEKKASDVEKKDQNKQFPYPIIWMPYGGQGEDQTRRQEDRNIGKLPAAAVEEKNKARLPVEERPPTFKLLKHPEEEPLKERIVSGDDASGAGTSGSRKTGVVKIIPVKQLDDPVPKSEKKEQEGELNMSVKNVESVKNGTDVKPSSPTKKAKLPPICLRVDPPRKKYGKGSSRSPSPPGEKRRQESSRAKEERKDGKIQVMEVIGNDLTENGDVVSRVTKEEKGSCAREQQPEAGSKLDGIKCEDNEVHAQEPQEVKESEHKESGAPERKVLSETEASVILQSAYRGYAVRRFEPLAKLRKIADVKVEASKVSERIEKLESCVILDDKEKVAIGEMIMNLLLKLDTIQGLHPSVRDVRKSVAKELIRLQEKLDSIVGQVSIPAGPHSSTITGVEQEHNAPGSDEQSAGSLEIISEASKTSDVGEKEAEEASVSEVPLHQSLQSQDTNVEEFGRESHNEEVVPPIGSSSECEVLGSCLEKKEGESDEIITPAEDPAMEIQVDLSTGLKDTSGQFRGKDQEGSLDAEAPDENVENDIQRMEWECDLGAVKTDREVDRGGEDLASALVTEKVAEKHGEVIVENDIQIETSGNCYKEQEDDQHQPIEKSDADTCCKDQYETLNESPQECPEEVEDDICRMLWECDIGAAKFTPDSAKQASEVENLEKEGQVDQLSAKSQFQSDDISAVDADNHTTAESCDEKNTDTRESDATVGNLDMDGQESEIPDGSMEVPTVEPVIEVEKQMITESPVSEGIKEECSVDLSTSLTNAQQYDEQMNLDETKRRIIEENEKLRSMVEQLLASGKDQQNVISTLTAKINALEKKLPPKRRNKTRSGKRPRVILTRNAS